MERKYIIEILIIFFIWLKNYLPILKGRQQISLMEFAIFRELQSKNLQGQKITQYQIVPLNWLIIEIQSD